MVVIQCGTGEHGAVGVESRAGDGRGAVVVEEAGVWLKGGQTCSINIVGLDLMTVGAPASKY